MGKHKNPITLAFLGLLRERGKMYNFQVEKKEHEKFDDELRTISEGFKKIEESRNIATEFKIGFQTKIRQCIALIEQGKAREANDAFDELIMLIKERIEKWDV